MRKKKELNMNTRSNNIDELAKALALAQKALSNPKKDAKNPFYKSNYLTLPIVLEVARDILPEYGLSFSQPIEIISDKPYLTTIIMHQSGQWMKSIAPIVCKDPNDPQKFGSSLTYLRRYSLQSMLGIVGNDEDDDANKGSNKQINDNEIIRQFLEKWGNEFGKESLIQFVKDRADLLNVKERPIVKMYTSNEIGFKKDFDSWLAKKSLEVESEDR